MATNTMDVGLSVREDHWKNGDRQACPQSFVYGPPNDMSEKNLREA